MRLNLGSGYRTYADWINVDRVQMPNIDLVYDLDVFPWPWADESISEIEARDIFEHVDNAVAFMIECHRILMPHKLLHLHTPHFSSIDAFTDPTHKRFPTQFTFDYWIPGTVLYTANNAAYGGMSFERVTMGMDNGSMDIVLRKLPRSV